MRVHVVQGEHFVTDNPDAVLITLLGSCVAACIRDPVAGIGGMNHFLLPGSHSQGAERAAQRYGVHAMELLVNALLSNGARRERLEAKLFGGGRMFDSLQDVGRANADFAERFLHDEGIPVVGGSLRGQGGRRVQFWPSTGRALQRALTDNHVPEPVSRPPVPVETGALELF